MKHILLVITVAFLSFGLAGCTSTSTIVGALSAIGNACSVSVVVVPVLVATGVVDVVSGALILDYTGHVSKSVGQAKVELASTDPNPLKITRIVGYFSSIAVPALPSRAGAIVMAIQLAVEAFLGRLQKPAVVAYAAAKPGEELRLSYADRAELSNIARQSAATSTAIAKWKLDYPVK
jgi:hypothetical protein